MTATRRGLASTVIAPRKAMSMDWAGSAACEGELVELFYGADGSTGPRANEEAAKRICRACSVITQCLAWAVETGEPWGIWGGTTPEERGVPEAWHKTGVRARTNARRRAARERLAALAGGA